MIRVWWKGTGLEQLVMNCDCDIDWTSKGFTEITDLSGFNGEEALANSDNTQVDNQGNYTYTSAYDLEADKTIKQEELKLNCDSAARSLTRKYSMVEQQSWPDQYQEAVMYNANSQANTQILDEILANCVGTGVTKEGLVATILSNAQSFKMACAAVVGQRIAKQDSITACTTRVQLESLDLSITI